MGLESAYLDVYTLVQYAGDVCWPGPESQPTFMSGTLFFWGGVGGGESPLVLN